MSRCQRRVKVCCTLLLGYSNQQTDGFHQREKQGRLKQTRPLFQETISRRKPEGASCRVVVSEDRSDILSRPFRCSVIHSCGAARRVDYLGTRLLTSPRTRVRVANEVYSVPNLGRLSSSFKCFKAACNSHLVDLNLVSVAYVV